MSSKSRKNSHGGSAKSNQPARLSGNPKLAAEQTRELEKARQAALAAEESDEPSAEDFLEAEELLKTPKGRSPLVYGSLILLLIFLLVVFVAGDAFYSMGAARGMGDTVMRWQHPTAGEVEVTLAEFREASTKLSAGAGVRVEDEDVAQYIVVEQLTRDAGVRVGDAELLERLTQIRDSMGGLEIYRQRFGRFPGNIRGFEEFVRGQLAAGRYRAILNEFTAFPKVDDILESWADQNQLYTFDHAYVAVDDYLAEARLLPPGEAELQAWFDELSLFERQQYEQQETRGVELVGAQFDDPERSYDALLAAYPDDSEEPVDELARAQSYYDSSYFTRYRRDEPIAEDAPDAPEDIQARIYYTFEEVMDQVMVEAAVKGALDRWRADLDARLEAGEELDLAAEAERLGLDRVAPDAPLTQSELRELEGLGGLMIAGPAFGLQEAGQLTRGITIGNDGLSVARVAEIVPASAPEAFDIRDQLLEPYAEDKAAELANEAIVALRATVMESAVDAPLDEDADPDAAPTQVVSHEAFFAAAESAGIPVASTVDLDRAAPRPEDPSPEETFLRSQFALYTLEEGQVDAVRSSFDGERVYLVRLDGKRAPDLSELDAIGFQRLFQNPPPADRVDPFSIESLREQFGLWLVNDEVETAEGEEVADGSEASS
ncbi:MAG: hypothetical protein AAFZ65_03085 [Planctomycetota bacterium]